MPAQNRVFNEYKTTIANAACRTLNATPVLVIPAPGLGKAIADVWIHVKYIYATAAFDAVGADDDLAFKFTDASGAKVCGDIETVGWVDQASSGWRSTGPVVTTMTPVENAGIVAHILTGEIYGAAGGGSLVVRATYRIVNLTE